MAIPIAITGSYNYNQFLLTSSFARVSSIRTETLKTRGTDFTGSYIVDVFFDSASFTDYINDTTQTIVGPIDQKFFSHIFEFDESDSDALNQVYDNLIASQSAFSNMTKKIYS